MTPKTEKKEEPKAKEIAFKCKFCEQSKPLTELVIMTRFFPPITACRDCERKMR